MATAALNPGEFHSANIISDQFIDFGTCVTDHYKVNGVRWAVLTVQGRDLSNKLFRNCNNEITEEYSDANNFWVRFLRDCLAESLGFEDEYQVREMNLKSVNERL
jgi:hypothetical protein